MNKKVAIIGGGQSRHEAPYSDESYDIWTLNEMEALRCDLHWEMHPMDVQNEKELAWLYDCKVPIMVLEETPLVPSGIVYPLDDILKEWWAEEFFCCTMCYQIAYAIYKKYQVIELWGFNMELGSPRERTVEAASMLWWMGIAKGMGIETKWKEHPKKNRWRYGYDYASEVYAIHSWLSRLAIHIIYRVGPMHLFMGGDDLDIRRKLT